MTEKVFTKENTQYKLYCQLSPLNFGDSEQKYIYEFQIKHRIKPKKKWEYIKVSKVIYRTYADIEFILQYLTEDEILQTAKEEYQKLNPELILKIKKND